MIINFSFSSTESYFLSSNKSRNKFHGVDLRKKSNLNRAHFLLSFLVNLWTVKRCWFPVPRLCKELIVRLPPILSALADPGELLKPSSCYWALIAADGHFLRFSLCPCHASGAQDFVWF